MLWKAVTARLADRLYARSHGVRRAELRVAAWRKSGYSNYNGSCVEVARLADGRVAVRDTKDHGHGPALILTAEQWREALAGVKAGQLDIASLV